MEKAVTWSDKQGQHTGLEVVNFGKAPWMIVETDFPADDSSVGYERGTSVSAEWEQATTRAAIEIAGKVLEQLIIGTYGNFDPLQSAAAKGATARNDFLNGIDPQYKRQRLSEIVDAFDAQPSAGVLSVGGKMVDRPHLVQARRVLQRASHKKE